MKMKTFIAIIITSVSFNVQAGYGVNMMEDCAQAHESIVDKVDYYNESTIKAGLIYPAVYKANNPDEESKLGINYLKQLAKLYWDNTLTDSQVEIAEDCQALKPEEIM